MNRILPYLLALLIIGLTLLAFGDSASSSDDGVLLRYRLDPGDVQVFEADVKLDMRVTAVQGGQTQEATTTMAIRLPFSIRCTATNDDGFTMNVNAASAGQQMTIQADERALEVKQNGKTVLSGEWGSVQLSQFPDLSKLLDLRITARYNDRGEIVEMGGADGLAGQLEGFDLNQALDNQVVFPDTAVKPGDSWTHELTQDFANAALPGATATASSSSSRPTSPTPMPRASSGSSRVWPASPTSTSPPACRSIAGSSSHSACPARSTAPTSISPEAGRSS
jgi:hypothetical protein